MKKRALHLAVALAIAPFALLAQPAIIIVGGKVFTNDPAKPWAEAVAITGNRIKAVGTDAEIAAMIGRSTRVIKLRGESAVPGFNDAHTHPGADMQGVGILTNPSSTWSDVEVAISSAADESPADVWIVGTVGAAIMLDPNIDRTDLDQVSRGRKVLLRSFTGHGIILSTAALEHLGLTREVINPPGGWYGRRPDGELNGRVFEYAQWPLQRRLVEETADRAAQIDALRAFSEEALRYGITSVQAMPLASAPSFEADWRASGSPLRVRQIFMPFKPTDRPPRFTKGVKWILDGTPIEQGAAIGGAYPSTIVRGRTNFGSFVPLLVGDQQLLFHASGDVTIRQLFETMTLQNVDWRPRRTRVEHADGLLPSLIDPAKRLGIVAVLNPTHFFARPLFPQGNYMPMRSLIAAGIPVAIGSDGPLNPFLNIMLATNRPDAPSEAVTREQAVSAYTGGSAFAEMTEREKGVIAPGMLADLAVLSQDIFTIGADRLPETTSLFTIIDGVVAYSAPEPAP